MVVTIVVEVDELLVVVVVGLFEVVVDHSEENVMWKKGQVNSVQRIFDFRKNYKHIFHHKIPTILPIFIFIMVFRSSP